MVGKHMRGAGWVILLCFTLAPFGRGYSILTHEEIVDLLWKDQIQPLLKKRFPRATTEDLRTAHAHAYGGSMLQDMGCYPQIRANNRAVSQTLFLRGMPSALAV
jgi:hypothetical protein